MRRAWIVLFFCFFFSFTACGSSHSSSETDGGGGVDGAVALDGGGGGADGGLGGPCDAQDAMEGEPCGPADDPANQYRWNGVACEEAFWCDCVGADCGALFADFGACMAAYASCLDGECATDADCEAGAQWCVGGACVPCDNGGRLCDIDCRVIGPGWNTYERNGCSPCACAPPNECEADTDCAFGAVMERCVPGRFCWDWCPAGDPSCCHGNVCAGIACTEEPTTGCLVRGCPVGDECVADVAIGCAPSMCTCNPDGTWACTRDCGGGVCVTPARG